MLCDYYPVLYYLDIPNHVNQRQLSRHLSQ